MAKKKLAVKMSAKKPAGKKPAPKKAPMSAKKSAPKKAVKAKTIKSSLVKTAKKIVKAVKGPTPAQLKAMKEREKKLLQKEKEKEKKLKEQEKKKLEAEKKKAAEQKKKEIEAAKKNKEQEKKKLAAQKEAQKAAEKKAKEDAKLKAKQDKENAKLKAKQEKEAAKLKAKKAKNGEDEDEMDAAPRRAEDDEDFDEFEEEYNKTKTKKSGKKAYEEDEEVDHYVPKTTGKKYTNAALAELETKIADEIAELREHFNWKEILSAIASMDFFIDPKNDECIEKGCDNLRTTQSHCRLHYLKNWKRIQLKKEILKEGKLQEYIEELMSKYPPKFIEALMNDLSDDKEFYRVLNELNIAAELDFDEDETEVVDNDEMDDDDIGIERFTDTVRYDEEG